MGTTAKNCPQCGAPLPANAPAGLCPRCVMAMNMATQTELSGEPGPTGTKALKQTPTPEELAAKFPQLEVIELLGRGGMGAVYKARQKELDRIVALKILPPGIDDEPAFAERFSREARALAKLNHPNIVTLYEFGRAELPQSSGGVSPEQRDLAGERPAPVYYFLMEFVDGVNLRQLLETGRVAPREALAIVPQICDALQYAHDQGIVHRDIKPENILLDRKGRVKVADFGLAKLVGDAARAGGAVGAAVKEAEGGHGEAPVAATALTEAGKVMGTPQYMAPEQMDKPGEVDHRADIYALGVVFYQMLTGELPGKPIAPPSRTRGIHIDVRLDEIVLRALEKKPELRYQTAEELKTQVETVGAGAVPPPEKAAAMARISTWIGGEIFWGNAAMFVLMGGILLTLIFWQAHLPRPVAFPLPTLLQANTQSAHIGRTNTAFGAVSERVLPDPDNGAGWSNHDTLFLRTGRMSPVVGKAPKEGGGRLRALAASKGDLFAEYDDYVGQRWAFTTAGLKLADFQSRQWDTATAAELEEALKEPTAMQHVEHSGVTLYLLPEGFLPLTLAFESRNGERGLLQVTHFHHEPRSVTIRYKLLQKSVGSVYPEAWKRLNSGIEPHLKALHDALLISNDATTGLRVQEELTAAIEDYGKRFGKEAELPAVFVAKIAEMGPVLKAGDVEGARTLRNAAERAFTPEYLARFARLAGHEGLAASYESENGLAPAGDGGGRSGVD